MTFDIDANGILHVSAKDKATNKEQSIRIESSSGLSKEEIDKMKAEAEANAETDKIEKEKIEKINGADSMIFQTEKQLTEYGEKLGAENKQKIESSLENLKNAHKTKDIAAIDGALAELQSIWQAASQNMYQEGQDPNANGATADANGQQEQGGNPENAEEVQDVEYEEVDEKKA